MNYTILTEAEIVTMFNDYQMVALRNNMLSNDSGFVSAKVALNSTLELLKALYGFKTEYPTPAERSKMNAIEQELVLSLGKRYKNAVTAQSKSLDMFLRAVAERFKLKPHHLSMMDWETLGAKLWKEKNIELIL